MDEKKKKKKEASTCCAPKCGPDACEPSSKKVNGFSNKQQKEGGKSKAPHKDR